MSGLNILIIGSGGREHTLAWKLAQSPQVKQIYVAPGNAGTTWPAQSGWAPSQNVALGVSDFAGLIQFAQDNGVNLVVVGPEAPLADGIADQFQAKGIPVFGPSKEAAQIEASKQFAKDFMQEIGIPTAAYATFTHYDEAVAYIDNVPHNVVVKASGLAAGKGVIVCDDKAQAKAALQTIMQEQKFGGAGDVVVIEERMSGPEVSILAFSDGRTVKPLMPARDHKRAYNNDEGPNTGGMGVYGPPADVDAALVEKAVAEVLQPTVTGLFKRGIAYVGILYAGLMLTPAGPRVLEFNCRFGDPETQVILPMLDGDLAEIMMACLDGRLDKIEVKQRPGACAAVVMASPGYPESYPKGLAITGTDKVTEDDTAVFHAGTKMTDNQLVTSGGRVLAVSAWADTLDEAVAQAYQGVEQINFDGAHYRTDIGR